MNRIILAMALLAPFFVSGCGDPTYSYVVVAGNHINERIVSTDTMPMVPVEFNSHATKGIWNVKLSSHPTDATSREFYLGPGTKFACQTGYYLVYPGEGVNGNLLIEVMPHRGHPNTRNKARLEARGPVEVKGPDAELTEEEWKDNELQPEL